MGSRVSHFLILAAYFLVADVSNAQQTMLFFGHDAAEIEAAAKQSRFSQEFVAADGDARIDIQRYTFNFDIRPEVQFVDAEVVVGFRLDQPARNLYFLLASALEIHDILDSAGNEITYRKEPGDRLVLRPEQSWGSGYHQIKIRYSGTPPTSGMGSFTFDSVAGYATVWTLNEPFGASDWFPTNNFPYDKIDTLSQKVTVPKPLVVASNGVLAAVEDHGNDRTYRWESRYPISPYLISLAIAPYEEFSFWHVTASGDSLPIMNYVYPGEDIDTWKREALQVHGLMDLFTELFGPYPFIKEKYGHAQFGFRGGMEHQTMSSMANLGPFLVAHELAHQWLGNAVTGTTWSDIWIQEGYASLAEALSLERILGDEHYESWFEVRRRQIALSPDGSVYVPAEAVVQRDINRIFDARLTYRKASWVLHMLRYRLGSDVFFEGTRTFLEQSRYGSAGTEDFRNVMEAVSGRNLQRFFDDWVYGEGQPMLHVQTMPVSGGAKAVEILVRQQGSHPSVPVFEFPLEIKFHAVDGDTILAIDVSRAEQTFIVDPEVDWYHISVDPHIRVLYGDMILTSDADAGNVETTVFRVGAPYPNPFNPEVFIPVELDAPGTLHVEVYDVRGSLVRVLHDAFATAGTHRIHWNAASQASGRYWIRIRAAGNQKTIPVTLVK